ncbi:hypothetical protein FI667_g5820, partial [Globisporangium splendens]
MFLRRIPNGLLFKKTLGHVNGETYNPTPFASAFRRAGFQWTKVLCKAEFPGKLAHPMTNGEAFGDPCCTWANGYGTEPQTIEPFTDTPTVRTVCENGDFDELEAEAEKKKKGGDEGDEMAAILNHMY